MIVVGITGSLASGKSKVTEFFKKRGAVAFDADLAAKRAVKKGTPVYKAIVKLFGKQFVGKGGELDRGKLAARVFANPRDLKKLNILIHPGVIFECLQVIDRHKKRPGVLALDVPLLFESKMDNIADYTVVVKSSRKTSLARAAKRGVPRELAARILATQWPAEKKAKLADFTISNEGSLAQLEKKAAQVLGRIKEAGDPKKNLKSLK